MVKVSSIPEGATIPWKGAFFQGEHDTPFGNKYVFYSPIGNFSRDDINLVKKYGSIEAGRHAVI